MQGVWKEIPASGIYCLEMNEHFFREECHDDVFSTHLTLHPWLWSSESLRNESRMLSNWSEVDLFNYRPSTKCFESLTLSPVGIWCSFCKLNSRHGELFGEVVPAGCGLQDLATETRKTASQQLLFHLCESIKKRTRSCSVPNLCSSCLESYFLEACANQNLPTEDASLRFRPRGSQGCNHAKVAVLFSGGIDSLVLAAIADRFCFLVLESLQIISKFSFLFTFFTPLHRFISPNDPIDLLNVSFVDK